MEDHQITGWRRGSVALPRVAEGPIRLGPSLPEKINQGKQNASKLKATG